MADETQSDAENLLPDDDSAAAPRRGMLPKMIAGGLISTVVIVECMLAYLYVPSVAEATLAAEEAVLSEPEIAEEALDELPSDEDEYTEVDLGQFSVQSFQPGSNTTQVIDFHLYGTIRLEDEAEWNSLFVLNEHRFRDQVIVIMRSAAVADLADPGLGLIKRKILKKSTETLGKPLLKSVIFSDYSFLEQ